MAVYKLAVTTGDMQFAGTWDHIYVTLIGSEGQSKRTELDSFGFDFSRGKTRTYTVKNSSPIGDLLLLKLEKDSVLFFPEDEWYCSKIVVTTPEDKAILFPCYRWISREELVELRGGKATKVFEENHNLLLTEHRKNELLLKKTQYQWKFYADGLPHCCDVDDESKLLAEIRFSESKTREIVNNVLSTSLELKLKGMIGSKEKWKTFEAMKNLFWVKKTTVSDYVTEHWKEDHFFGYQFLNGLNPMVIKHCSKLPSNFPVTNKMVRPFLAGGTTLHKEIEKGNIFICDYKKMAGIPPRSLDGKPFFVASGFCLFYVNPQSKLLPIAIQLQQEPSEDNPIFLPNDSESDWLLAKMFIKNADFMEHQGVYHLNNTHLFGEIFAMATYRNLPMVHPIYKLLIPHFRYNIEINIKGRSLLLGPGGPLTISSLGREGILELMKRAMCELTYSSLCLPDNITARGLESIPNFYYRDDGLRLWGILNSFVREMVKYYYPSDDHVCKDSELQEWIKEVFIHGVIGNSQSGFPESFKSAEELVKFVTMTIFTVTAQHAVVNNGQFDLQFWIPNGSLLLDGPPPNRKGKSSMETVMETLPNLDESATFARAAWTLSYNYTDMIPLGTYPEHHFDEPVPKQIMKDLQAELAYLSDVINDRNTRLDLPYNYLNPPYIENSIAI